MIEPAEHCGILTTSIDYYYEEPHLLSGLGTWLWPNVKDGQNMTNVSEDMALLAAFLTARAPMLALLGAQLELPRVQADESAALKVKWERTICALAGIRVALMLAVAVTFGYCRWLGVVVRDHDSFFSIASLLQTILGSVRDRLRIVDGAKAVERYLRDDGRMLRYGTRRVGGSGNLELDIWDDVKGRFSAPEPS
jgi:hypothetical protein